MIHIANYWDDDWPNLNSVSLVIDPNRTELEPEALGILIRLVWHLAVQTVNSAYDYAKDDPRLVSDEARIARIAMCDVRTLQRARPSIEQFFIISDDGWRLRYPNMIRLSAPVGRENIPTDVKHVAKSRSSGRCTYCGTTEGPFHNDHLFPVAKGGTNDPSNIVLACAPCNLAKGDKTLKEWMELKYEL